MVIIVGLFIVPAATAVTFGFVVSGVIVVFGAFVVLDVINLLKSREEIKQLLLYLEFFVEFLQ